MKLEKLKITILCLLLSATALAQSQIFTLSGKINPSHNGEVVTVAYPGPGKLPVKDSTVVKDGTFTISGQITTPGVGYIRVGKIQPANSLDIYIAAGNTIISATDSLKYAVIGGNTLALDYQRLMEKVRPLVKERAIAQNKFVAIPAADRKGEAGLALMSKILDINKQTAAAIYDFIDNNPNSYVSLDFLEKVAGSIIKYDTIMPHYEKLSDAVKNTPSGVEFGQKILASNGARIGAVAKGFESTTPDGKKLTLNDVVATGKYTLLDFWASWCGPCRAENPNVVKAYKMYHDKGFNILSVSLDTRAENWKAAIAKDGMPWNHVSSLLGWKEPAAVLYGVSAIPQNVLLDSKGVVVATNLRGEALLEKLKQLLL